MRMLPMATMSLAVHPHRQLLVAGRQGAERAAPMCAHHATPCHPIHRPPIIAAHHAARPSSPPCAAHLASHSGAASRVARHAAFVMLLVLLPGAVSAGSLLAAASASRRGWRPGLRLRRRRLGRLRHDGSGACEQGRKQNRAQEDRLGHDGLRSVRTGKQDRTDSSSGTGHTRIIGVAPDRWLVPGPRCRVPTGGPGNILCQVPPSRIRGGEATRGETG